MGLQSSDGAVGFGAFARFAIEETGRSALGCDKIGGRGRGGGGGTHEMYPGIAENRGFVKALFIIGCK